MVYDGDAVVLEDAVHVFVAPDVEGDARARGSDVLGQGGDVACGDDVVVAVEVSELGDEVGAYLACGAGYQDFFHKVPATTLASSVGRTCGLCGRCVGQGGSGRRLWCSPRFRL